LSISCYSEELAKTGVTHYAEAYSNVQLSVEDKCVEEKMTEGMTYEEAKAHCKSKVPTSSEDVDPEDIYHGLDSCVAVRTLGGETKEVARKHCLMMFTDPNIKAAFENDAEPGLIGLLLHKWNVANDPRSQYVGMRRDNLRWQTQRESAIDSIKAEIKRTGKYDGKKIEWLIDSDLTREATKLYNIRQGKLRREQRKLLAPTTVGCLYKADRKQLLADAAKSSNKSRLTVGNLYGGKTQREIAQDYLQAEQTPLERCVKARMETKGESYKEALETCKYILKEGFEP